MPLRAASGDCPYVGYYDRYDPEGWRWRGATSRDAVIATLQHVNEHDKKDKKDSARDTQLFA